MESREPLTPDGRKVHAETKLLEASSEFGVKVESSVGDEEYIKSDAIVPLKQMR